MNHFEKGKAVPSSWKSANHSCEHVTSEEIRTTFNDIKWLIDWDFNKALNYLDSVCTDRKEWIEYDWKIFDKISITIPSFYWYSWNKFEFYVQTWGHETFEKDFKKSKYLDCSFSRKEFANLLDEIRKFMSAVWVNIDGKIKYKADLKENKYVDSYLKNWEPLAATCLVNILKLWKGKRYRCGGSQILNMYNQIIVWEFFSNKSFQYTSTPTYLFTFDIIENHPWSLLLKSLPN